jgi:DNA modification methylase
VHAIPYDEHDDDMDEDKYIAWQTALLKECRRVLKPGGIIFYHHTNRHVRFTSHYITDIFKQAGVTYFDTIYWDEGTSVQQATDRPTPVIEPIYLLTRDNLTAPRYNTRAVYQQFRTNRWNINKARCDFHPCVFPSLLVEMCILLNSKEGDVILDLHAGSGSVLLAAHNLKRRYLGFDISEGYQQAFLQQMQA